MEGCRPQAPAGTDADAPAPFKPPLASAAFVLADCISLTLPQAARLAHSVAHPLPQSLRLLGGLCLVKETGRIFSASLRKSPPSSPLIVWIFAVHGPRRRRRKLRTNRFRLRRKLNHCAVPPLPTKPCGFVGPLNGNGISSRPAVSPPIVRQNRRYAGRCPAPRPRTKNSLFYRPSSRWRSRFLSCSDMPRIRSALFFAVISSIIFARACFSSG